MKKLGYIMLLTVLLLQTDGILLIYKIEQCIVQHEMQQTINNNETHFEKLTLSFNEYQKSKINAGEISVHGKMYDVKSINFSGDNVELLVINDSKEEIILKKITTFANKTNQRNSDLPNQLQQLLSLNYLSPDTHRVFFIPSCFITVFPIANPGIISNHLEIFTPPPKFI